MGDVVAFERPIPEPEAAKLLGMTLISLQRERRAGKITYRKLRARSATYTSADLDEYIERQKVPACDVKTAPSTSAHAGYPNDRTARNGAQPVTPEAEKLCDWNPFAPQTKKKQSDA